MENLLSTIKYTLNEKCHQPFSVYSSIKEQKLLNVPIAKPLLIVILTGDKEIGVTNVETCHSGEFVFLANSPSINMRNIPKDKEYFALLIEFDFQDFIGLQSNISIKDDYFFGKTTVELENCLRQFVEASSWAPKVLWSLRKREILSLLCHMGHEKVLTLLGSFQIKDQIHEMFIKQGFRELTIENICKNIAMSESTLRRKLKLEGTSVQEIKDQARLGLALHLLQTSSDSISVISDKCGYQSHSRFTERFKRRFGLTPTELKRTKMTY